MNSESKWDISGAVFNKTLDISLENTVAAGMFLRADGLKMYIIDFTPDVVVQYSLSVANDISTATPDSKTFDVTDQAVNPQGVWFKNDGKKMSIAHGWAPAEVFQYSLSVAWDVSTASYDSKSLDTSSQSEPRDLFITEDGTELYAAGPTGSSVYQYTLSVAHDISTGTFTGSFSVTTEENSITDVFFKSDGARMFIVGLTNDTVFQYDLSTNFDVTSAVYNNVSFSVAAKSTTPQGVVFNATGSEFYIVDSTNDIYSFEI